MSSIQYVAAFLDLPKVGRAALGISPSGNEFLKQVGFLYMLVTLSWVYVIEVILEIEVLLGSVSMDMK